MTVYIVAALTLAGIVIALFGPLLLMVWFARWALAREATRRFERDHIAECADVAKTERELPDMRASA